MPPAGHYLRKYGIRQIFKTCLVTDNDHFDDKKKSTNFLHGKVFWTKHAQNPLGPCKSRCRCGCHAPDTRCTIKKSRSNSKSRLVANSFKIQKERCG